MDAARYKRFVGSNLRIVREGLGLSQQQFADRFDLGDKTRVSHYEVGKHFPDPHLVYRLWKEEGIPADAIYLGMPRGAPAPVAAGLRSAAREEAEASQGAAGPERGRS